MADENLAPGDGHRDGDGEGDDSGAGYGAALGRAVLGGAATQGRRVAVPHAADPSARAEVVRFGTRRTALTAERVPALRELFGLASLPLAEARVEVELRGVPTAVVNAVRRTVLDEMRGLALQADGFDTEKTTEVFMLPQFVLQRIALIPLRARVPAEVVESLRFRLEASNKGEGVMSVYAGDMTLEAGELTEPLFNPTFRLATLQPGKTLAVHGIRVVAGHGRDDAAFAVARCAAYRHLDIPQHPEAETHDAAGAAVDDSGYKVSCLEADPRHHLLTAVLPATTAACDAEARAVFAEACACVRDRLRLAAAAFQGAPAGRQAAYAEVRLENGLSEGVLRIPGETHTVGEVIKRAVYDLTPDLASISYMVVPHENRLELTLRCAGGAAAPLQAGLRHSAETFETLRLGMLAAPS